MGTVKKKNGIDFKTRITNKTLDWIHNRLDELPHDGSVTIQVTEGKDRSLAQNRLAFVWYKFLSQETGETKEEARLRCKLTFGVPILMEASDRFMAWWLKKSATMNYEEQLEEMFWTDVTSLFTVKQFTEYLETMERESAKDGYVLPTYEDAYYEAMGIRRTPLSFDNNGDSNGTNENK